MCQMRGKQCGCCTINKMIVILVVIVPLIHCQRISSLITSGQPLCPSVEIVLTCETSGSNTIAWRNLDYVGTNNDLDFVEFDDPGTLKSSTDYVTTVANLTRNILENNIRILESELHITVRSDVASTSVSCVHDNGNTNSFTVRSLDIPGMGDIASDQRESSMGGCTVLYSWSAPNNTDLGNISHFMVFFNGSSARFNTTGNSVYMRAQSVCTCASHNITIFAVDRCGRNGQTQFHVVSDVPNFDATCKDSTFDHMDQLATDIGCNYDGLIIGLSVVSVAFVVYLIATLIVIILMCCGIIPPCSKQENGKTSANLNIDPMHPSDPISVDSKQITQL